MKLKNNIMRRVYMIFVFRKITSPFSLKLFMLGALFIVGNLLVSVKDVLRNMPSWKQADGLYDFYVGAFLQTELAVQIVLFGIGVLFVLLFKDILTNNSRKIAFS
ncbi:MAG TPA: hypothetical protein VJB92_01690 [Candidatus Paceibacterota bacterium]